jgi:hypothetical protein
MNVLVDVLSWFTAEVWIDLATLLVTIVLGAITIVLGAIPIYAAWKKHTLKAARNKPGVRATINRTPSIDGWRSIQLHLTPPPADATFQYGKRGWRIDNAKLLSPCNAKQAFARDDDHSLKGLIAGLAPRLMSGRTNHPQPFAIRFLFAFRIPPTLIGESVLNIASGLVTAKMFDLHRTVVTWAEVPFDAETNGSKSLPNAAKASPPSRSPRRAGEPR